MRADPLLHALCIAVCSRSRFHSSSNCSRNCSRASIFLFNLVGLLNVDELFTKAELHQCIACLPVSALGEFFAGDPVGKTGDVDDALIGVQKLRLSARLAFRLDDQRRQTAVGRRQPGRQPGGSRADNHDVPVGELREVDVVGEFGNFEIGHEWVVDG